MKIEVYIDSDGDLVVEPDEFGDFYRLGEQEGGEVGDLEPREVFENFLAFSNGTVLRIDEGPSLGVRAEIRVIDPGGAKIVHRAACGREESDYVTVEAPEIRWWITSDFLDRVEV